MEEGECSVQKGGLFMVKMGLVQEAWTHEGEGGDFLAWKGFLSPDRQGQSDNELQGKLSYTMHNLCVYMCVLGGAHDFAK